jgi:hypothetical protein
VFSYASVVDGGGAGANKQCIHTCGDRHVGRGGVRTLVSDALCAVSCCAGDAGPKPDEPEAAAVSAAALAFFRNRASAPRDMSAAATVQFRAACDAVLAQVY